MKKEREEIRVREEGGKRKRGSKRKSVRIWWR